MAQLSGDCRIKTAQRQFIILESSLTGQQKLPGGLSTAGTETAGQSPHSSGLAPLSFKWEQKDQGPPTDLESVSREWLIRLGSVEPVILS